MRFQELLTCVKQLKIEARRVLDKTIRGDTVGIGRDHACYAPDPTDPRSPRMWTTMFLMKR